MTTFNDARAPVFLTPHDDPTYFPDPERALREPDGLLAVGGDLSTTRLIAAYRNGIFPWFNVGEPVLWWSPDPRAVLLPNAIAISRSLRKTLKKKPFRISFDEAFDRVVHACAGPRQMQSGTWITPELRVAYGQLHQLGIAHSIECWNAAGELVGGVYGIALGRVFFGESMFSHATNASKIALVYLSQQLARWQFELIDCQVASDHILSMGASMMPRREFTSQVRQFSRLPQPPHQWRLAPDPVLPILHV